MIARFKLCDFEAQKPGGGTDMEPILISSSGTIRRSAKPERKIPLDRMKDISRFSANFGPF
jgi:hypothetical protein